MSWASFGAIVVFFVFVAAGLALFLLVQSPVLGMGGFVIMGLVGSVISGRLFDRFATSEERRREMEDRVRDSEL